MAGGRPCLATNSRATSAASSPLRYSMVSLLPSPMSTVVTSSTGRGVTTPATLTMLPAWCRWQREGSAEGQARAPGVGLWVIAAGQGVGAVVGYLPGPSNRGATAAAIVVILLYSDQNGSLSLSQPPLHELACHLC